ncbi:uncharacterized protein EI97DRAFT_312256 [Westerdykella ornata]|uniref:Uncharacterized protein n=1 Tax=Westerdykella ornata TaxID=318751 RepID=A0A6A6JM39_WESOR|nr:uncharacterized protein EI97DRAFT_312256 [Westerdykella ornata]KAF2277183.1 hypothetical protein EI97DRAFT_312256 [Westerdykella ornata]
MPSEAAIRPLPSTYVVTRTRTCTMDGVQASDPKSSLLCRIRSEENPPLAEPEMSSRLHLSEGQFPTDSSHRRWMVLMPGISANRVYLASFAFEILHIICYNLSLSPNPGAWQSNGACCMCHVVSAYPSRGGAAFSVSLCGHGHTLASALPNPFIYKHNQQGNLRLFASLLGFGSGPAQPLMQAGFRDAGSRCAPALLPSRLGILQKSMMLEILGSGMSASRT